MTIEMDPYSHLDTLTLAERTSAYREAAHVMGLIKSKFPNLELIRQEQAHRLALVMSRISPFASPTDPVPEHESASFDGAHFSAFHIKEIPEASYCSPILQIRRTRPIDPEFDPDTIERSCFDFTQSLESYVRTRPNQDVGFQRQEDDVVRRATASDLQKLYSELETIPSQE